MIKRIKRLLFIKKWQWENRRWQECRHKRRAFKRELAKYDYANNFVGWQTVGKVKIKNYTEVQKNGRFQSQK